MFIKLTGVKVNSLEFGPFLAHYADHLKELLVIQEPLETEIQIFQHRVPSEAIGACWQLQKLSLSADWLLSDEQIRSIGQCTLLRELSIGVRNGGDYLSPLRGLPHLFHFHCNQFVEISPNEEHLIEMFRANLGQKLTHLSIIFLQNPVMSDDVLQAIAEGVPRLKILHLGFYYDEDIDLVTLGLTDSGISHLMRMSRLKMLHIQCPGDRRPRSVENAEFWPIRGNFLANFVTNDEKLPVYLAFQGAPFRYIQRVKVDRFVRQTWCSFFGYQNSDIQDLIDGHEDLFRSRNCDVDDICCLSDSAISDVPAL